MVILNYAPSPFVGSEISGHLKDNKLGLDLMRRLYNVSCLMYERLFIFG